MSNREETILIVDNECDFTRGLSRTLEKALAVRVLTARSGPEALAQMKRHPMDLIVSGIKIPEMNGMVLLETILKEDDQQTVIMMTANGTIDVAVSAMKKGAWDFIEKPFAPEHLIPRASSGLERHRILRQHKRLTTHRAEAFGSPLVGSSPPIHRTLATLRMLGKSDVTCLIRGESGTGKELAARTIHQASHRKEGPFITVNCPALPEGLMESTLFGHRKGAFTGAESTKKGLFDQAEKGTLFLDEIGDISPALQTKLLRVLQNREVHPLGAATNHTIDVRILAATHQNLEAKMVKGSFRADLFYRLNIAPVTMPPLRDLRGDIPMLVEHFLAKASRELGLPEKRLSPALLDHLCRRPWPGNTRELENTLTGWMALTPGNTIHHPTSPPFSPLSNEDPFARPYLEQKAGAIEAFTRDYLHRLLSDTSGNITLAAQKSAIKRQSLQKIIQRYAIDMTPYRQ